MSCFDRTRKARLGRSNPLTKIEQSPSQKLILSGIFGAQNAMNTLFKPMQALGWALIACSGHVFLIASAL